MELAQIQAVIIITDSLKLELLSVFGIVRRLEGIAPQLSLPNASLMSWPDGPIEILRQLKPDLIAEGQKYPEVVQGT